MLSRLQGLRIANFKVKNLFFQKKPNQKIKFDKSFFRYFLFHRKMRNFQRKKRQRKQNGKKINGSLKIIKSSIIFLQEKTMS